MEGFDFVATAESKEATMEEMIPENEGENPSGGDFPNERSLVNSTEEPPHSRSNGGGVFDSNSEGAPTTHVVTAEINDF